MKPIVQILCLPGQKVFLMAGLAEALEHMDIPSPFERCLGRLADSSNDQLIDLKAHSWYSAVDNPTPAILTDMSVMSVCLKV
jgi:hypothetical protein